MLRKLTLVGVLLTWVVGCNTPPPTPPTAPPDAGPEATKDAGDRIQGLTKDERDTLYHLSTGSEMIPLAWLKALENVQTGKPLLEDVTRYGLIPDPGNPDGLPIGLTVTDSRAFPEVGKMVGANCAACHVGEITVGGKSKVILGAPNLLDFNEFVVALNESVQASLKPDKLPGFLARIAKQEESKLSEKSRRLAASIARLMEAKSSELGESGREFVDRLKSTLDRAKEDADEDLGGDQAQARGVGSVLQKLRDKVKGDVGRLREALDPEKVADKIKADAERVKEDLEGGFHDLVYRVELLQSVRDYHRKLKKIHDQMEPVPGPGRIDAFGAIRDAVMDDANFVTPDAPVSYPHLWPVSQIVFFHWDANTNSMLQRDVGQTLGLGAIFRSDDYFSTVLPQNLAKFEHMFWKLRPPKWPEDLFKAANLEKAGRGKDLYAKHCIECHKLPKSYDTLKPPPPYADDDLAVFIKLSAIRTDPARTANYQKPVVKDGKPAGSFADALRDVAYQFTQRALRDNGIGEEEAKDWDRPEDEVQWPLHEGYVARPLDGIWAAAPYLHNGSVPTLYDLLQPADQRPKSFYVGYREYDPDKLGYVSEESKIPADRLKQPPIFRFDATAKGNLNVGHEYGTKLKDEEKSDLLEYLKTL